MKKINARLLSLVVVLAMGCGDKDDDNSGNGDPDYLAALVGTWEVTLVARENCTPSSDNTAGEQCLKNCPRVTIRANGTYDLLEDGVTISESGTVSATATHITICAAGETNCGGDAYNLSNGGNTTRIYSTNDSDFPNCTVVRTANKV